MLFGFLKRRNGSRALFGEAGGGRGPLPSIPGRERKNRRGTTATASDESVSAHRCFAVPVSTGSGVGDRVGLINPARYPGIRRASAVEEVVSGGNAALDLRADHTDSDLFLGGTSVVSDRGGPVWTRHHPLGSLSGHALLSGG